MLDRSHDQARRPDLPVRPADLTKMPERAQGWSGNLVPNIEPVRPGVEGAQVMAAVVGCEPSQLPDGEGWGDERIVGTTHLGTHVDAPLHYGSQCEGKPARTISDLSLEEGFVDGIVLDLRGLCGPGEGIAPGRAGGGARRNGAPIPTGGAVLLRTGQEAFDLGERRLL